jgi:hypothetical protein
MTREYIGVDLHKAFFQARRLADALRRTSTCRPRRLPGCTGSSGWSAPSTRNPTGGCRGPAPRGRRSDRGRVGPPGGHRRGARADAAGGDRRHRALCRRPRAGLLRGVGAARRAKRRPLLSRPQYPRRVAVVALGVGRSGAPCDPAPRCDRAVGPSARRPQRHRQSARRAGARLMRRPRHDVAP